MHDALYSRHDIRGKKQKYCWDKRNVLLLCAWFHTLHGRSKWLQKEAAKLLVERYGEEEIQKYLERAPLKEVLHLEQLLWG